MTTQQLLAGALLWGIALCQPGWASDIALTHAKIYTSPSDEPIADGTVILHNGFIRAVGPGRTTKIPRFVRLMTVLDCRGAVITAGLWNSHVHIFTPGLLHAEQSSASALTSQLESMLTRWGFTTVFDTASLLENTNLIKRRIAAGEVLGPEILTTGEPFYAKGGVPVYVKPYLEENHITLPEVESNEQAVARVWQQIQDGANGIKIFAGSIKSDGVLIMPLDMAKTIVAEAHRLHRPVFAHPSNEQGIEVALESGVDVLAHVAPMSGPWTATLAGRMKAAHLALIPTLTLFDVEARKARVSPRENEMWIDAAVQQLKLYAAAGGQILFGTDVGYIDHFDTGEEYSLMARAGMSFEQVLASLTTNPAERFGHSNHSGRIAKGMDADLVVLDGDPAKDITEFSKVRYTIGKGKIIYSRGTVRSAQN